MSSFTDLKPEDTRTKRRRDDIYLRSSTYFFKNLTNNTLEEADFSMYQKGFPIDHRMYFEIADTLSLKIIQRVNIELDNIVHIFDRGERFIINYSDTLSVDQYGNEVTDSNLLEMTSQIMTERKRRESNTFSVLYRRRQSDIILDTDTLLVDYYGNIDQIDKVVFSGQMGLARAGDMLPMDYEP
jgi:phage tail protein X